MLAAMSTGAALADVKSGVDAWQRGEFKKAVAEWRAPALAGDPDAQFNLGQAYKLGRGVDAIDPVLAQSWFLKAAKQGHLQAADNYGIGLYNAGNYAEAAPWLEKSVARGEPRTELVLATMLFNGTGVPRDPARAYALMSRASQQGIKAASENLAQMDGAITNADRERGIQLAQQYAAQQDALRLASNGDTRRSVSVDLVSNGDTRHAAPVGFASNGDTRRSEPLAMAAAPSPPRPRAARHAAPPPGQRDPAAAAPPAVPDEHGFALAAPRRAPTPRHEATEPTAATGRWRVQLGAFHNEANAREQWARVAGALRGARPSYVKAGAVTRLQAGPFASRAAAATACRSAKVPCDVLGS